MSQSLISITNARGEERNKRPPDYRPCSVIVLVLCHVLLLSGFLCFGFVHLVNNVRKNEKTFHDFVLLLL